MVLSLSRSAWGSCGRRSFSFLSSVPLGPADPILNLTEAYNKDPSPVKVNLGVGAFRDATGKPWVLPSVEEATKRLSSRVRTDGLEYTPISGDPAFLKCAAEFAFGSDCPALSDGRIAVSQALSGTGSLRIGFEFLKRFTPPGTPVYVPTPTWGNHVSIIKDSGLQAKRYRYLRTDALALDFSGFVSDIRSAPRGSIFLLHACAHNPTGVDPTNEQWCELSDVLKSAGHIVFFDSAYQGFATGDAHRDAFAIRHFLAQGHNLLLAQSFAKNFGLYGERVGALSVVTDDAKEAACVRSQLKLVIRPMYSSPPVHGSRIVTEVLKDKALSKQWYQECSGMAHRIADMRDVLTAGIIATGSKGDWSHIKAQIGMFCYTGLTGPQVNRLIVDHHIYMTADGRISMAGVNPSNVEYVASCFNKVTSDPTLA